jgi:hypothetical protein
VTPGLHMANSKAVLRLWFQFLFYSIAHLLVPVATLLVLKIQEGRASYFK